jgi:hypothetical protein
VRRLIRFQMNRLIELRERRQVTILYLVGMWFGSKQKAMGCHEEHQEEEPMKRWSTAGSPAH